MAQEMAKEAADVAAHEAGLLDNPILWVAVAFVILLAMVWKKATASATAALDARAARIAAELEEAKRLREEAQALFARHERQHRDSLSRAEEIVAHAREEAHRLRAQAEEQLKQLIEMRERQAVERIAQAEAAALRDVRNATVDLAVAAAGQVLEGQLDGAAADKLIDQAVADLPRRLAS